MMQSLMKKLPSVERYNQILWALIGSGVVLAVLASMLIVAAVLLLSMLHTDRGGTPVAVITEDSHGGVERSTALYDFCMPLAIQASPYQLIRVVSDQFAVRKVSSVMSSKMSYEGYGDSTYESCGIHGSNMQASLINVIIRDVNTGLMNLLLKENAVIQTLEYPQPSRRHPVVDASENSFPPAGTLYLEMSVEDGNGDGVIDDRDDLGAYLSDLDGKNFDRITPLNSRVLAKTYDKKRGILTMRILPDSNNDRVLDEHDKPVLLEVNVKSHKMMHEVLDAKNLTQLMQQAEPKRKIK